MPHFQSWITTYSIKSADKILCAVSGGVDSMVLLDLLFRAGMRFEVMHMNYQLRGKESDLDQELVETICAKHKITFHCKRVAKPSNCNTQEWARNTRYAYLAELDEIHQYKFIATAHHQQDQLETILMSIFKGYSLQTIKSIRNKIIRPLLHYGKNNIIDYASANDIEFRNDQSNFSNNYDRNFLRNELIPPLRNRFENFDKRVLKFAERQTNKNNLLDALVTKIIGPYLQLENNNLKTYFFDKIDLSVLEASHGKSCLNLYLNNHYGFNIIQVDDVLKSTQASPTILNQNFICKKDQGHLMIGKIDDQNELEIEINSADFPFKIQNITLTTSTKLLDPKQSRRLMVDYELLHFPLKLRKLQESDKFQAFGLRGKTTSLTKFLKDKGISSLRRLHEYVLIDASNRIIVPGIEIDYGLKITKRSKTALFIDLQDKSS